MLNYCEEYNMKIKNVVYFLEKFDLKVNWIDWKESLMLFFSMENLLIYVYVKERWSLMIQEKN